MTLWLATTSPTYSSHVGAYDCVAVACVDDGATKLAYSSVPSTGTVGTPFSVTVQSQTASGVASNVAVNTTITLSKAAGGGALGGTTSGTITAGTSSVTISGVTYDTADTMRLTATASGGQTLAAVTIDPATPILPSQPE